VVAYETAYLKKYYPVEFFAAMLTSVMGNNDKVAFYIDCCKRMGMEVLPPDINESSVTFTVSGGRIRFGLAAIKNVGKSAIMSIIKARKQKGAFVSFTDFCQKVSDGDLNKRAAESLIKAGAFDSMGSFRSQLLAIFEQVMDGIAMDRKRNLDGQLSIFEMAQAAVKVQAPKEEYPEIKEYPSKMLLAMEKEMLGLYISGHPLSEFEAEIESQVTLFSSDLSTMETGMKSLQFQWIC
jgi:DNA polymerase-3 subunit alpha